VSKSGWECFSNAGFTHGIVRAWHSFGGMDDNAKTTLQNGAAAGYSTSHLNAYMFPCPTKPADEQVKGMVAGLSGAPYSRVWFDIESNGSPGCSWSTNTKVNCAYMGTLIDAGSKAGLDIGVYASDHFWCAPSPQRALMCVCGGGR
jgi:hypothetical protein